VRLKAIGSGNKARTAIATLKAPITTSIPGGQTLTLRLFDHGSITAWGTTNSLTVTVNIYNANGQKKASQIFILHSITSGSVQYNDKHVLTFTLPGNVAPSNGWSVELVFTATSTGDGALVDFAQNAFIYGDPSLDTLYNLGFIHVGYVQLGTYWIAFGG